MKSHLPWIVARRAQYFVVLLSVACTSPSSDEIVAPVGTETHEDSTKAPANAPKPAAQKAAKSEPEPSFAPHDPASDEVALGANGEPDPTQEKSCVAFRWITTEPTWKRAPIAWDAATRTLQFDGGTRRYDAQYRVLDFGEGTVHLEYDDKGNVTFRGEAVQKTDYVYRYRNTYDKTGRLTRADVQATPVGGKPDKATPYRHYTYDAQGRVTRIDLELKVHGPIAVAKLSYDAQGRVAQVEWQGANGESERDRFIYDSSGRLGTYERDGLIFAGAMRMDGNVEWRQIWTYDEAGRPVRVEATDGETPERSQRDLTLFSPACASLKAFAPDVFVYPYLPLPDAIMPHWAGQ